MKHWTQETVFSEELETLTGTLSSTDVIDVSVKAEVPMDGATRLERRGNRWYPTFVDVAGRKWDETFTPAQARAFAAALVKAADAADAIDKADTDACGHWFPCSCTTAIGGRGGEKV